MAKLRITFVTDNNLFMGKPMEQYVWEHTYRTNFPRDFEREIGYDVSNTKIEKVELIEP